MNNEQIIEERFVYFWNLLLNNPNQFFLIKKRQNGGTREERAKERNALLERLETSFKLMNLPYERRLNKMRAVVVKPVKKHSPNKQNRLLGTTGQDQVRLYQQLLGGIKDAQ